MLPASAEHENSEAAFPDDVDAVFSIEYGFVESSREVSWKWSQEQVLFNGRFAFFKSFNNAPSTTELPTLSPKPLINL